MKLAEAVETLTRREPIEVQRESRFVIEPAIAASATLQTQRDVAKSVGALADDDADISSRFLEQGAEVVCRHFEPDLHQPAISKQAVPGQRYSRLDLRRTPHGEPERGHGDRCRNNVLGAKCGHEMEFVESRQVQSSQPNGYHE